ncbi:hypothetical protein M9Y10_014412 [Tritrichomonas musculus]|uniref:Uncharacterized protein n=1 Tax=Tritrichomonas musculus TaxID=1915356 RepID=A0ABR2KZF3_9EUKA
MSLIRKLSRESDSGSSDGFDQLSMDLPQYNQLPGISGLNNFNDNFPNSHDFEDDFAQWQLTRFNRKSIVNVSHILTSSYHCVIKNFNPLIFFYLIGSAVNFFSIRYKFWFIYIPFDAFSSLFKTSISISLVSSEQWNSRLHFLLTKSAFTTFLVNLINAFLIYQTIICLFDRSSRVTIVVVLLLAESYTTFFFPCFVFEARQLKFSSSFSFSLRISFCSQHSVQMVSLFLLSFLLHAIGPFTLGLLDWTADIMKPAVFIAVCGSERIQQ